MAAGTLARRFPPSGKSTLAARLAALIELDVPHAAALVRDGLHRRAEEEAPAVPPQAAQGTKWAQDKRNIRALMGKAEVLWAEENLPAPRIINRMARAWGLNGTASSDFNRLCELAAAQVTFSQDDAWKRIQTYTPDSDTSDEPPMCECGKGTQSGEGPYPELCIRCANERANAEAASQ